MTDFWRAKLRYAEYPGHAPPKLRHSGCNKPGRNHFLEELSTYITKVLLSDNLKNALVFAYVISYRNK